jgi:hypothetical protein
MRSILASSALVATAILAAACSEQRSPLPTEPPVAASLTTGRTCPSPLQLAALTVALFAPGDLLTFARSAESNISLKMSRGDVSGARKIALAFIDFTLQTYYQGKLRDPNGPNPPTTAEAVVTLIDGILCWVGLPPSGLQLSPTGSDVTVTTKVIGAGGGQFTASDALSGLKVPAGAVSEDRLFVITRRDDLAKAGTCVSSGLKSQIPLCVDFAVVPAQAMAKPLVVAICQPEGNKPVSRRLAHKLPDGKVELLAFAPDPFPLVCTETPDFPPPGSGGLTRAVWGVGSFLARVLGPQRLHASHSGLGGLLGPNLSPVTAVVVRLSFEVQPSNTEVGEPISPAVQVAYRDSISNAIAPEIVNQIHVTLLANPGHTTLEGDTIETPSNGVATFTNLHIGVAGAGYSLFTDALSSDFTGTQPISIPDTSNAFDVGASWVGQSSATENLLYGVWGSSGSDVFAVGEAGTVVHYDGESWTTQDSRTSDNLYAVWGSGPTDVFAVGGLEGTILHYDGEIWTQFAKDRTDSLFGVWGTSHNDVFAVGYSGTILHYDGTSWTPQASGTGQWLHGVWGTSGTDVFAVGTGGTILHYNGTTWTSQTSGTEGPFQGVWGATGTNVFAVGDGGAISHYNGSTWTSQPTGVAEPQLAVWGTSGSNVFAVGNGGTILRYNGTSWTQEVSGTFFALWSVWGTSATDIFAVGSRGTVLHRGP